MKKTNKIIVSSLLALALSCSSVFAAFPTIRYNTSNSIKIELANPSIIETISAKGAAYNVTFFPKTTDDVEFIVEHSVDGGEYVRNKVKIPAARETVKTFNISVDNGIHTLNVKVYQGENTVAEFKDTIYVMDIYEHQFMDELSGRGVNAHIRRTNWKDNEQMSKNITMAGGYKVMRGNSSWPQQEKQKGKYDFTYDDENDALFHSMGVRAYDLLPYGSGQVYPAERGMTGGESWPTWEKTQPQTHDSIWGYANYATNLVAHKGPENMIALETWNEPNHYTAPSHEKAQKYTDFNKATGVKLLYEGLDKLKFAPYSLAYNNEVEFVNYSIDYGLWPYVDAISHHPYVHGGGYNKNQLQEYRMQYMEDIIIENGGWKDRDITEIGCPTPVGGVTEEQVARDMPRLYTVSEDMENEACLVYDLINDGTEATYTEHNFGQVTIDYKPKPSYISTVAFNNNTQGGILLGQVDCGIDDATRAYLYHKDGKPIVIAWSTQMDIEDTVQWNLGNESVDVYDKNNNLIESGVSTVTLGDSPVYIMGLSDDWYAKAAYYEVSKKGGNWIADYSDSLNAEDKEKIKSIIEKAKKDFVGTPSPETILETLNAMYNFGFDIVEYKENGTLEDIEVSRMLYMLYRVMQRVARFYMSAYEGEVPEKLTNRADQCYDKAKVLYKDNMQMMQYSEQILRHALKNKDYAEKIMPLEDNPNKAGAIIGYDMLAEYMCGWFDAFSAVEDVIEVGYVIQTPYYDRYSYVNTDVTFEVNLDNYSRKDFAGTIQVTDEDGNIKSESEPLKIAGDGGYKQIFMTLNTRRQEADEDFVRYYISYVDNERGVVHTQPIDFIVYDKFEAETLPAVKTTDKLDSVTLKIQNKAEEKAIAHVKLKSDENFEFGTTEFDVEIEALGAKEVDVPISSIRDSEFHFYTFSYEISDEKGNITAADEVPMSFTAIQKAKEPIDVKNWTGDISDWVDAYPVYINAPDKPTEKASWNGAECSSRLFAKWDEENLYLLADIYDERYLQEFNGGQMWQGDCIQLALDPQNDGDSEVSQSYGTDDYELGFTSSVVGMEYWAWFSPNNLPGGAADWFKIIRNEDEMITRYLIKLDKSVISTLNLEKDFAMALNIAVNDADILGRENYYQFTEGLADAGGKHPSKFAKFTFSDVPVGDIAKSKAAELFPVNLQATEIVFDTGFEDTKDHWAKETIEEFRKLGFVEGVDGKNFKPDELITRAEFLKMLVSVAGCSVGEYLGGNADVSADSWYAPYIQSAANNGQIPAAMMEDTKVFPEKEITRAEAAYIAMNLGYVEKMKVKYWHEWTVGDCDSFDDGAEIDEWMKTILDYAVGERVFAGRGDNKLYPNDTVTRAEAVVLLRRIMPYLPN